MLLAALPMAFAQPSAPLLPRIGILMFMPLTPAAQEDFRRGFRERGYVEGRNIAFEWRSADGSLDRANAAAEELAGLKVRAIVAEFTPAVQAAQRATKTIPIVMASAGDPLGSGLVSSLAHPGGNVTGFTNLASELSGKRLELLREVVPGLQRVGLLLNGRDPLDATFIEQARAAARAEGMQLRVAEVPRPDDLEPALEQVTKEGVGAAMFLANIPAPARKIAELAGKYHLPSIAILDQFPESGGLMSYGASLSDIRRRVAGSVDRILKGANPGDLPVEQPTKFDLVINLRTAHSLGITVPPSLLVLADRVIQ